MKGYVYKSVIFIIFSASLIGCSKYIPEDRDSLDLDAGFTKTLYEPVLGRHEVIKDNFNALASSKPIEFTLLNVRRFDGEVANELLDVHAVKVWNAPYTGKETSLEAIEAKRSIENRPLFEIGKYNGSIALWPNANSRFVRTQPDSCYLFDVEVSSTGGRKYFRRLQLKPIKERPFEPSNQNRITGQIEKEYVSGVLSNVKGHATGRDLVSSDMRVYFNKLENNPHGGNTLTFKFLDSMMNPININEFDMTDTEWKELVHGFNMVKTNDFVRFQVAYPIPLMDYRTKYTNAEGSRAVVKFKYSRMGFGQLLEESFIGMNFSIYEQGDWEIYFVFPFEKPRFRDE